MRPLSRDMDLRWDRASFSGTEVPEVNVQSHRKSHFASYVHEEATCGERDVARSSLSLDAEILSYLNAQCILDSHYGIHLAKLGIDSAMNSQ